MRAHLEKLRFSDFLSQMDRIAQIHLSTNLSHFSTFAAKYYSVCFFCED
jgi:hypothetical protein